MTYHIQDVLKSVRDGAPAPGTTTDDIIARAGRIRARRAATAVAGGVVACVAVVVTAVAGLGAPGGGQQVAAPPAPSGESPMPEEPWPGSRPVSSGPPIQPAGFTTTLGEYRVGAYRIGPAGQVAPGYQQIPVYRDGRTWETDDGTSYPLAGATITVYRAGVYDPATFGGPGDTTLVIGPQYRASVGDKPAIGRDMTFISPVTPAKKWVRASLAWQYAPNAWATLIPGYDTVALSRADAVKIAAGLVTGQSRELRVPYRLGFLPGGWRPVAVTQTPAQDSSLVSKVFLHDGPLTLSAATVVDEVYPHSATITVAREKPKDQAIRDKDGLHCDAQPATCTIVRGPYLISVGAWNGGLSSADLQRIAQGLSLSDLDVQRTWVPLGD